jgi:hypothetical protein
MGIEVFGNLPLQIKEIAHDVEHFNPLNAELNPFCHLLALVGSRHILHLSSVKVKEDLKSFLYSNSFYCG